MRVEPGVYVIGCFERRVTLYSQQVRALNLIYSLVRQGLLQQDSAVAVIGAGPAGMTAAAGAAHAGARVTRMLDGALLGYPYSDTRTLRQVGIEAGMTLEVVPPLDEDPR